MSQIGGKSAGRLTETKTDQKVGSPVCGFVFFPRNGQSEGREVLTFGKLVELDEGF